jgi:hypothetical protein
MATGMRRAGGFVVGIVLFLIGFSLLQPSAGIVQTGVTTALAAVLTALGIGVIAAAALPQTLEVGGTDFKPLGVSVKASGGAAVFVLTLGFIYYMKDVEGAVGPPPAASATEIAGATPTTEPTPAATEAASEDLAAGDAGAIAAPAPPPASNAAFQQLRQQLEAPQSGDYYLAWTWCSACCPQGPDSCAQVGLGEGPSPDEAGYYAAEMCVRNGGYADTCSANVQYLSANDLAELGY